MKKQLERRNQNKAAGPDCISPRFLKTCAEQLCGSLQYLFNLSLSQEIVPVLWKVSCLAPVPKKYSASALTDDRPDALTSHIMKVLQRLLLAHLSRLMNTFQDPQQFVYRPGVGVNDLSSICFSEPTLIWTSRQQCEDHVLWFLQSYYYN